MAEPYLGEIRIFPFGFTPQGWAPCNGALLPINQNQALFSLLGTAYGGDGKITFALPDLRGRTPVHQGNGVTLGQSAGEEAHVLTAAEMPAHTHQVGATNEPPTSPMPTGGIWAQIPTAAYSSTANTTMNPAAISAMGNGQGHPNMQPYMVANFCIALNGIFPSRN